MSRKVIWLTISALLIALIAASCGGGDPTAAPQRVQPTATSEPAPTLAPTPTSVPVATPQEAQPSATGMPAPTLAPTPTPVPTATPTQGAPAPQEVIVGTGVEPRTLDSALTNSRGDLLAIVNNMEGLTTVTSDLDPTVPSLAVSWSLVDPLTWEFNLRENVKFHDGTVMTADDVGFVFERISNPDIRSNWRSSTAGMGAPNIIDATTIRLTSEKPIPTFLQTAARAGISPKGYVQSVGETNAQTNPIGTGPYRFLEWQKGVEIRYEVAPDYWADKPSIFTLVFRPILEDAIRVAAIQTGAVQVAVNIPYDDVERLGAESDITIIKKPSLTTFGYIINTTAPTPLTDKRVRQALNYAINRELLIEEVLNGNGIPLKGQPASSLYFGHDPTLEPYPYDLDKAKQLLADAGYPDGFELPMVFPAGYYIKGKELTEIIAGELGKIGITATVQSLEFRAWLGYIVNIEPGLIAHGQNVPGDVHFMLSPFLEGGYFNYWDDADFESLVARAATESDVEIRTDLYHQAFTIMREESPRIDLWQVVNVYAVDSRLTGFDPWPDERLWFASARYQ